MKAPGPLAVLSAPPATMASLPLAVLVKPPPHKPFRGCWPCCCGRRLQSRQQQWRDCFAPPAHAAIIGRWPPLPAPPTTTAFEGARLVVAAASQWSPKHRWPGCAAHRPTVAAFPARNWHSRQKMVENAPKAVFVLPRPAATRDDCANGRRADDIAAVAADDIRAGGVGPHSAMANRIADSQRQRHVVRRAQEGAAGRPSIAGQRPVVAGRRAHTARPSAAWRGSRCANTPALPAGQRTVHIQPAGACRQRPPPQNPAPR